MSRIDTTQKPNKKGCVICFGGKRETWYFSDWIFGHTYTKSTRNWAVTKAMISVRSLYYYLSRNILRQAKWGIARNSYTHTQKKSTNIIKKILILSDFFFLLFAPPVVSTWTHMCNLKPTVRWQVNKNIDTCTNLHTHSDNNKEKNINFLVWWFNTTTTIEFNSIMLSVSAIFRQ